jgi:tetratricopeptide (TPR) repeat protein
MKRFLSFMCIFPVLFAADVNRGIGLYNEGKLSDAKSELEGALQAEEGDAKAHRYLGLVYLENRQMDEALDHLKRADEIEPGAEAKAALARYYAEKMDFDQAQVELKEFDRAETEVKAGAVNADYARGLVQLNKKQYDAAVKSIEGFLKSNPNNGYAHYYAGLAYNGMGRKDKMLSEFELFLRIHPGAPEARKVRAVLQTGR